jgi:lysophospholipase L1-like esterase
VRRRLPRALLALAGAAAIGAAPAAASSITISSSPPPQEDVDTTFTIAGSADVPREASLFRDSADACAPTAGEATARSTASRVIGPASVVGNYSLSTTPSPQEAGEYLMCAYLGPGDASPPDASAGIRVQVSAAPLAIHLRVDRWLIGRPASVTTSGDTVGRARTALVYLSRGPACAPTGAAEASAGSARVAERAVQGAFTAVDRVEAVPDGRSLLCGYLTRRPAAAPNGTASLSLTGVVPRLALSARNVGPGRIAVTVQAPPDTAVQLAEQVARRSVRLGSLRVAADATSAAREVPWRCDRRARTLVATTTIDGTRRTVRVTVKTPGCAGRLDGTLRPGRLGATLALSLVDRWGTGGVSATACETPLVGFARCRGARLGPRAERRTVSLPAETIGPRIVEVRTGWGQRLCAVVSVQRRSSGRPVHLSDRRCHLPKPPVPRRVLATGDSMIQIIDFNLIDRLRAAIGARVISDAHISTGISKPFLLDWRSTAREQAARLRPDVTIMFLGANDGFPMGTPSGRTAPCCDASWITEYARRAALMMRAYMRGGVARVYWLTLPEPRTANFARVFHAVNRAIVRAARRFPGAVNVVDLRPVFTPGGRFRSSMPVGGRSVVVRQDDGVHLSVTGARIAADVIIRAMARDGLIRRRPR